MKISKKQSIKENWDKVKSWNYKLKHLSKYQSVVYAELDGDHGEVETKEVERIYYVIEGDGFFEIGNEEIKVSQGDVVTVPPHTKYNYHPIGSKTLKVLLFMDLWDN